MADHENELFQHLLEDESEIAIEEVKLPPKSI